MSLDAFEKKSLQIADSCFSEKMNELHQCFSTNVELVDGFFKDADISAQAWDAYQRASVAAYGSGKNGVYIVGRGMLGTGEYFENGVKAAAVWTQSAFGDRETAAAMFSDGLFAEKSDEWTKFMDVPGDIESLGDEAEVVGKFVAGAATTAAAYTVVAGSAIPVAAGAALAGVAALGAAGESLASNFEKTHVLTNEMLLESGIVAGVTAVGILVPGRLARAANNAELAGIGAEKTAESVIVREGSEEVALKNPRYIEGPNSSLEGAKHPITGVEFERRIIYQESGDVIEGVFPNWPSVFEAKIPPDLYTANNQAQFKVCNSQLLEAIEADSKLKSVFSAEQLSQIREGVLEGSAPDGFVWNHNEREGVLQLVDAVTHSRTGHIGGRSIWGGGY